MLQVGWAVGHWSPHSQGSWAWPEGTGVPRLAVSGCRQHIHPSCLVREVGEKAGKHRPGLLNLCLLSQKPAGGAGVGSLPEPAPHSIPEDTSHGHSHPTV